MTTPLAERFWSKVEVRGLDECWPWLGGRQSSGRGYIRLGPERGSVLAYSARVAWELTTGLIPEGMWVCHQCDNVACVNRAHLFLGTASDNARDMVSKGRGRVNRQSGERNHAAKITDAQVASVRADVVAGAGSYKEIGRRYGVSSSLVHLIVHGRRRTSMAIP